MCFLLHAIRIVQSTRAQSIPQYSDLVSREAPADDAGVNRKARYSARQGSIEEAAIGSVGLPGEPCGRNSMGASAYRLVQNSLTWTLARYFQPIREHSTQRCPRHELPERAGRKPSRSTMRVRISPLLPAHHNSTGCHRRRSDHAEAYFKPVWNPEDGCPGGHQTRNVHVCEDDNQRLDRSPRRRRLGS